MFLALSMLCVCVCVCVCVREREGERSVMYIVMLSFEYIFLICNHFNIRHCGLTSHTLFQFMERITLLE
jgi:hypothetical protein